MFPLSQFPHSPDFLMFAVVGTMIALFAEEAVKEPEKKEPPKEEEDVASRRRGRLSQHAQTVWCQGCA
jgi:hypothetical protein